MPMIIDGHNLIGKMSTISLADPHDEEKLIQLLAQHLLGRGRKITVVFDKGTDQELCPPRMGKGLRIIFASPESSADDIIIGMIKEDPNPKGLTIVTSDNEIRRRARSRRARLISSEDFAKKLESAPGGRPPRRAKADEIDVLDVEEWLDYFKRRRR